MLIMAANRIRSIAIITGRLRRNSTHGASGTATSAPTASPAADSADTCGRAGVQHQDGDQRERAEPEPRPVGADRVRAPTATRTAAPVLAWPLAAP